VNASETSRGRASSSPVTWAGLVAALFLAAPGCTWSDPLLTRRDAAAFDTALDTPNDGLIDAGNDGANDGGLACPKPTPPTHSSSLDEGLVAWYRCEMATGPAETTLPDSSPNGRDGLLVTGAATGMGMGGAPGYTFTPGKVGAALSLNDGRQGYVALPAGVLSDACEATLAVWVYLNSSTNAWGRIWDFGQDTNVYMFLTPTNNISNVAKFAISIHGNTSEQVVNAPMPLAALKWSHVAVVLGASGGTLYLDGAVVGTNPAMTLRPIHLGRTANNYIGRSQFSADPYLDASIDELRLYNRALSQEEIQALAGIL